MTTPTIWRLPPARPAYCEGEAVAARRNPHGRWGALPKDGGVCLGFGAPSSRNDHGATLSPVGAPYMR